MREFQIYLQCLHIRSKCKIHRLLSLCCIQISLSMMSRFRMTWPGYRLTLLVAKSRKKKQDKQPLWMYKWNNLSIYPPSILNHNLSHNITLYLISLSYSNIIIFLPFITIIHHTSLTFHLTLISFHPISPFSRLTHYHHSYITIFSSSVITIFLSYIATFHFLMHHYLLSYICNLLLVFHQKLSINIARFHLLTNIHYDRIDKLEFKKVVSMIWPSLAAHSNQ